MKTETPEEIKQERDALLTINGAAQKREEEWKMIMDLLILAGHVTQERVEQARKLVRL
jgi:hypothetical protein